MFPNTASGDIVWLCKRLGVEKYDKGAEANRSNQPMLTVNLNDAFQEQRLYTLNGWAVFNNYWIFNSVAN